MDTPHRPDTDTTRPAPARRKRPRRLVAGLAALLISVLAPATVAPAAVGQTAEDETHTLTVKILDHNGETPCLGCVPAAVDAYNDTWDRDNPHGNTYYRIPGYATSDTATRSVEVVTGVYTLIGNLYKTADHADRTSVTYLIEVEVPVEGDTTVVLDAREAVLMEPPTVPKTDAQVRGHTFTLSKEGSFWDDNSWADYGEYLDGTNYASLKDFDLYITPFPEPTLMRLVLVDNWIMAEPQEMRPDPYDSSGTQLYSDTPAYMYHVPRVYTAGFDAGTLEQPYTSDDFTTVPTHYHSDYDDALIGTISKAFSTHHLGGRAEVVMFRPGKVLQHYLASDEVVWRKSDWIHRDETAQPLRARTYEAFPAAGAGTVQPVQDRHSGPVRVAVSDTDGPYTDLWKSNSQSDPYLTPYVPPGMLRGGEHGERFRPTFCLNDNAGGIRFYSACPNLGTWQMQNADTGQILLPDLTQLVPVFTGLPAKKATYRLEQRIDVVPDRIKAYYRTQPAQSTVWTFTSAASDAQLSENFTLCGYMPNYETDRTCQIQPLLQLRYMLDLNTWNRAPAGQRHAVAIEASYLPEAVHVEGNGSIRPKDLTMTVQATFDDGATWQPVDLKQQGRNFRALIDHPALDATSGFVGLRVTATDTTTGATIKQVHHRAYMLE